MINVAAWLIAGQEEYLNRLWKKIILEEERTVMGDREMSRGSVGVWQDVAALVRGQETHAMKAFDDDDYEEGRFVGDLIQQLLNEHHRLRVTNKGGRRREGDLNSEISGLYHAIQEAGVGVALIAELRVAESIKAKTVGLSYTEIPIDTAIWNLISELDVDGLTKIGVLCAAFIDGKLGEKPAPETPYGVTFTDEMESTGKPWEGVRGE